jgi:hypothetical protein
MFYKIALGVNPDAVGLKAKSGRCFAAGACAISPSFVPVDAMQSPARLENGIMIF